MCIAVPGRIESIGERSVAMTPAEIVFPDRAMTVNLVMLPDAKVGDHVVVHSGYAIRIISRDAAEAATTLFCLDVSASAAEPTAQ